MNKISTPFVATYAAIFCSIIMAIPSLGFAAGWAELSGATLDGTYYRSVSAVSDTVLAFGSYGSVKSTDSGLTWGTEVPYSGSSSPTMQTGIAFGGSAVAMGVNGDISVSLDLGTSWTTIRSPLSEDMNSVAKYHTVFPSSYALYAAGENGAVMKSLDGGTLWTDISTSGTATFNAVGVASPTTAWVAGDNGAIYKTVNGGTSWITEDPSTSFDINTISVIDETHLWIGGEGEFLAYTSNGGITWTQVTPTEKHVIGEINSLEFLSATEGYMARSGRCIWHTTDSGATWDTQDENCGIEYNMISASSNGQLYAIGHDSDAHKIITAYDDVSPTVGTVSGTQTTAGTSGVLTVSATDNYFISSCQAEVNGVSVGDFTQQSDAVTYTLTYAFPSSGSKTLTATCVDTAGNSTTGGSSSITIATNGSTVTPAAGDLIKTACAALHDVNDPCTAVYYLGSDGKRHAFTNEKVYFSWYSDFNDVVTVDSTTMASFTIGHNVTYKPGITMVKFLTLRTVFAVEKGGILHGVGSESLAASLYGSDWNTQDVDDISDTFYRDYTIGSTINTASDYNVSSALSSTSTIDDNF